MKSPAMKATMLVSVFFFYAISVNIRDPIPTEDDDDDDEEEEEEEEEEEDERDDDDDEIPINTLLQHLPSCLAFPFEEDFFII